MFIRGLTTVKHLLNLDDYLAVRGIYIYAATYLKIKREAESNGSCTEISTLTARRRLFAISKEFVGVVLESVDDLFQDKFSGPI